VQQLYARFAAMAGHSSAAVMTPSKALRSGGATGSSSGVSSSSKKRKASGGQQQQQQQQGSIAFVHKVVGELQAKGGLAAAVSLEYCCAYLLCLGHIQPLLLLTTACVVIQRLLQH
jgi:hypothetical protein